MLKHGLNHSSVSGELRERIQWTMDAPRRFRIPVEPLLLPREVLELRWPGGAEDWDLIALTFSKDTRVFPVHHGWRVFPRVIDPGTCRVLVVFVLKPHSPT